MQNSFVVAKHFINGPRATTLIRFPTHGFIEFDGSPRGFRVVPSNLVIKHVADDDIMQDIKTDTTLIINNLGDVDNVVDSVRIDTQQILTDLATIGAKVDGVKTDVAGVKTDTETIINTLAPVSANVPYIRRVVVPFLIADSPIEGISSGTSTTTVTEGVESFLEITRLSSVNIWTVFKVFRPPAAYGTIEITFVSPTQNYSLRRLNDFGDNKLILGDLIYLEYIL